MTPREKIGAAFATFIFVGSIFCLVLGFRAWMEQHDARLKAESVEAAQQQIIDQAKTQADAAKADAAKANSDLKARLEELEAQKKQPVTAPQFVVDLNKLLPNLPQPVAVAPQQSSVVSGQGSEKQGSAAAAPTVVIPEADLPALRDYKLGCDENSARLDACNRVSGDQITQLNAARLERDAMAKERDSWKSAAKGGTFLQRVGKRARCLAISGVASALGAWADKQQPARGAAIGATAGGIGCELF